MAKKITHLAWDAARRRAVEIGDDLTTAADVRLAAMMKRKRCIQVVATIVYVSIWAGVAAFIYAALCTPWLAGR